MKRPWMPLYIADYLQDTTHLGALESGAYLHLIMSYWQNGKLPDDDQQLARIAKMTDREWRKARPTLRAFFHDGWKHKRIDAEIAHATDVSEKRKNAASIREQKRRQGVINGRSNDPSSDDTLHTSPRKEPIQEGRDSSGTEIGALGRVTVLNGGRS